MTMTKDCMDMKLDWWEDGMGLICGYAKERAGRNGWKKKDVGELDRDGDKGKGNTDRRNKSRCGEWEYSTYVSLTGSESSGREGLHVDGRTDGRTGRRGKARRGAEMHGRSEELGMRGVQAQQDD